MSATATPVYLYQSNRLHLRARLSDPKIRDAIFGVGCRSHAAPGRALFIVDVTIARDAASAILNNLLEKGLDWCSAA